MFARCLFAAFHAFSITSGLRKRGAPKSNDTKDDAWLHDPDAARPPIAWVRPDFSAQQSRLDERFNGYVWRIGENIKNYAEVASGPVSHTMLHYSKGPGQLWQVRCGGNYFKTTIEDATGASIEEAMQTYQKIPNVYRRGFEIVSSGDGVSLFTTLGGAAGTGWLEGLCLAYPGGLGPWIITHEVGHVLQAKVWDCCEGSGIMDRWSNAIYSDGVGVSEYGDSNPYEDLAEYARLYAGCLDRCDDGDSQPLRELYAASPQRFQVWESILVQSGGQLHPGCNEGNVGTPAPTPPPPPPPPTQCYCRTPGQGTNGYNGYDCDDGSSGWCQDGQECYLGGWWERGSSYPPSACRTVLPTYCLCRTPGQGTSGYNGYDCDDGTDGWCQGHQECYLNGWWPQGQSYPPDACRTPGCSWRQTGNCDPNGPREPHSDRACWEQIPAGWSGFCDCNGNNYKDWDEPGYDCSSTPYRCDTACR